jgi:hypothetical protein
MEGQMEYKPRPWTITYESTPVVRDAEGGFVFDGFSGALTKRIVQAINERDDLIAQRDALKEACEALQYALENVPIGEIWTHTDTEMVEGAFVKANAALALVHGEGE